PDDARPNAAGNNVHEGKNQRYFIDGGRRSIECQLSGGEIADAEYHADEESGQTGDTRRNMQIHDAINSSLRGFIRQDVEDAVKIKKEEQGSGSQQDIGQFVTHKKTSF